MVKDTQKKRQPSARITRKREQARREILAAAETVLADGGIEAVTLASVADQLGMTKQAIYHYFSSKEALVRGLVTTLLDHEIEVLTAAVTAAKSADKVLGTLIRAFYRHYIDNLDALRAVYCRVQLYAPSESVLDDVTLRDEVHPRTRRLFDILEEKIAGSSATRAQRRAARQRAYTAWTSALGLMTMIGVADATNDPLSHPHKALLNTLASVFDE